MKRMLLSLALMVLMSLLVVGVAFAQEKKTSDTDPEALNNAKISEDGTKYLPGELVVLKKGDAKKDNIEIIPVEEQTLSGLKEKAKKIKASRSDAEVVEPNYVGAVDATPNDYWYSEQYFFTQIGAPSAWNDTKGAGARICIVDTGYDRLNPEFTSKVVAERDFLGDDNTAQDGNGHGTHVAGLAAVETNNNGGTAGVGWDSKLVIAKAASTGGTSTTAFAAQALNYCQNVGGVSVVNMSLGFDVNAGVDVLESEVIDSYSMGQTVVASAGNDGTFKERYPAAFRSYVIGVGATNSNGSLASFSNKGPSVDLVAPGVDILSAWPSNSVRRLNGTSMSSPQVAGAAALLYAKGLDRDQVKNRLFSQAEDRGVVGRDDYWGYGFLNIRCAAQPSLTDCN